MTDGLITSRRNFLQLFGATIAAVALPIQQLSILAPAAVEVEQLLPPNILHVKQGSIWQALGELSSFDMKHTSQYVDVVSDSVFRKKLRGSEESKLNVGLFHGPGLLGPLHDLFCQRDSSRYAISLSGGVYEFDALMLALKENWKYLNEISMIESELMITSKVELRSLA